MVAHAEAKFPNECCGAMIGSIEGDVKDVAHWPQPLENAYSGAQGARYELRPEDLLEADKKARAAGLDLIGIFHSHPDCDAYFSKTDLENSCPWYSRSSYSGEGWRKLRSRQQASCANAEQTAAEKEELDMAKVLIPTPLRQFAD